MGSRLSSVPCHRRNARRLLAPCDPTTEPPPRDPPPPRDRLPLRFIAQRIGTACENTPPKTGSPFGIGYELPAFLPLPTVSQGHQHADEDLRALQARSQTAVQSLMSTVHKLQVQCARVRDRVSFAVFRPR